MELNSFVQFDLIDFALKRGSTVTVRVCTESAVGKFCASSNTPCLTLSVSTIQWSGG